VLSLHGVQHKLLLSRLKGGAAFALSKCLDLPAMLLLVEFKPAHKDETSSKCFLVLENTGILTEALFVEAYQSLAWSSNRF
jgi:predicted NACHT family NTPase